MAQKVAFFAPIDARVDARMVEKVRPPERNGLFHFHSFPQMQSGVCLVSCEFTRKLKLKTKRAFLT